MKKVGFSYYSFIDAFSEANDLREQKGEAPLSADELKNLFIL